MLIKKLTVKNFRSLKEIEIKDFKETTIFYGENNAGKSNILKILHLIFQRKINPSLHSKEGVVNTPPQTFMRGKLTNFKYNFFNNFYDDIYFEVVVEILKSDITYSEELIKDIFDNNQPASILLTVKGYFKSLDPQDREEANIEINIIQLNNHSIYIFNNKTRTFKYFPEYDKDGKEEGKYSQYLTELVEPLNDCVQIIDSVRDIKVVEINDDPNIKLSSESFKNYLYNLSLNIEKYSNYERIIELFNSDPFAFGQIAFAKDNKNLEIMVKNGDVRLPIENLGSGVIQTLFIITSVISNNYKIICIEELEQNLSPHNQLNVLKKLQSLVDDSVINQLILSSHTPTYADSSLGLIYFIEKADGETTINEKETKQISKELFQHLSPSFSSLDLYTPEELERSYEEVKRLTMNRLRD